MVPAKIAGLIKSGHFREVSLATLRAARHNRQRHTKLIQWKCENIATKVYRTYMKLQTTRAGDSGSKNSQISFLRIKTK